MQDLEFSRAMSHFKQVTLWAAAHIANYCIQAQVPPSDVIELFPEYIKDSSELRRDTESARCRRSMSAAECDFASIMSAVGAETERQAHADEARTALMRFLEWSAEKAAGLWPNQTSCINGTLVKLYAKLGARTKLSGLLRDSARVLPQEISFEEVLRENHQCCALGWLWHRQGFDEQALVIWKQVAVAEVVEQPEAGAAMAEQAVPPGVEESIELLSMCERQDILVQHSRWLLQDYPNIAIKIFVPCRRSCRLDPQSVIDQLQYYTDELMLQFLEYAADNLSGYTKEQQTMLHTRLALRYLETCVAQEPQHALRKQLRAFLDRSDSIEWASLLKHHCMSGESGATMVAEKAILFRKSHQHYQALSLLVWHQDSTNALQSAEEYCTATEWDEQESETVFNTLLQVYLTPPPNLGADATKLPAALTLLEKYGDKFNPVEAIGRLPPSTPIKAVNAFLEKALMHTSHICRTKKIEKQMSKQRLEQLQLERMRATRSRVQVLHWSSCAAN